MYAAEIDGIWLPDGADVDGEANFNLLKKYPLVELKTTREFPPRGMHFNFRR
jgi:hypothetical protein